MSLEKYIACDDAATDSDGTFLGASQAKACKTLENALLDGQQANVGEQVIAVAGDAIQQAENEQLCSRGPCWEIDRAPRTGWQA